ncbi:MAG TPA: UbiD family decarboxylase [Arachidicoccus sp.]|nr:UbiD family decarboxylase [Arachidicoccus sp.]
MAYASLEEVVLDLDRTGQLLRIYEEVDPSLEMATIQLRVYAAGGPAILFEKVKGTKYRAISNLFGTLERSKFLFRDTLPKVQELIALRSNPLNGLKHPFAHISSALAAFKALPLKNPSKKPILFEEIRIQDLPQIKHWEKDGGAFITLPQVYSENIDHPGIMQANLGMYRIQLSGGMYAPDKEIGVHYQIHRGIGIHQKLAGAKNQPLKVSIFVGGPPAHTLAAVMPLPEGLSELTFAGLLGGRRFRYFYHEGYMLSADADFVITGEIHHQDTKPEGPFGDHLGYYSLAHPFPYLKVYKVYAKKAAIWPFTVVGRPPQEDTSFGELIHEITGSAIEQEIPGLKAVHAVDAAGVHPLLLALGSERYTPYSPLQQPAEILTIANRILGTGQLSLAKYLLITADPKEQLSVQNIPEFLQYVLERIDFTRDLHFQTCTTIDTLDYSGTGLNTGSKVIFAAYGPVIRNLINKVPDFLNQWGDKKTGIVLPGILAIEMPPFTAYLQAGKEIDALTDQLLSEIENLKGVALIVLTEDVQFIEASLANFLWVTFTRSNPASDIYGVDASTQNKHWGCKGPIIIDSRKKPHHAPALELNAEVAKKVDQLLVNYPDWKNK